MLDGVVEAGTKRIARTSIATKEDARAFSARYEIVFDDDRVRFVS